MKFDSEMLKWREFVVPIIEFGATDQEETVARVKRKELIQTLADVLVDGATLECDRFKRIGDPSAEEVRSKKYKKERMQGYMIPQF